MVSFIEIQKRLLPDLLTVMQKRYYILQYIKNMQPVGRRSLAVSLGLTERVLRSEVEFLKDQQLVLFVNNFLSYPHFYPLTNNLSSFKSTFFHSNISFLKSPLIPHFSTIPPFAEKDKSLKKWGQKFDLSTNCE